MPLTDRHEMIRHTARSFAEKEIRPVAAKLDDEEAFPDALYRKMAEIGLFGVSVPEEDGGVGADMLAFAIVMEEIARGYSSLADELGNVEMVGTLLSRFGTPGQKERYLAPLLVRPLCLRLRHYRGRSGIRRGGDPDHRAARRRWLGLSAARRCGSTTRRIATSPWCWRGRTRKPAIAA